MKQIKAIKLEFLEGVSLRLTFQDGKVKQFDMAELFDKYPAYQALTNRKLFLQGELDFPFFIYWNDEIDINVGYIYEHGMDCGVEPAPISVAVGYLVTKARERSGLTQKQLAEKSHIDQADISRIESGHANPSVQTLERIAAALDLTLNISLT